MYNSLELKWSPGVANCFLKALRRCYNSRPPSHLAWLFLNDLFFIWFSYDNIWLLIVFRNDCEWSHFVAVFHLFVFHPCLDEEVFPLNCYKSGVAYLAFNSLIMLMTFLNVFKWLNLFHGKVFAVCFVSSSDYCFIQNVLCFTIFPRLSSLLFLFEFYAFFGVFSKIIYILFKFNTGIKLLTVCCFLIMARLQVLC